MTPSGRWTPHLAAACTLLLVVAVAGLGGVDPNTRGETLAIADGRPPVAGQRATSSGIPGSAVQVEPGDAPSTPRGSVTRPPQGFRDGKSSRGGGVYDPGVTDSEIRVGGSTFTSGPAALYGEQIAVGFAAGVNYVNDHGGINGRRVTLKIYDDGADPVKQLTNVKRLVEVDKVFALAMAYAPNNGEYVAQKGIPVFHLGQFNEEFVNPWWFPVGGPQRVASYWTSEYGYRQLGVRKVAVFYLDAGAANYSRAYAESVAEDWKAYGAEVPVLAPFAPDQTSCSDAIGKARDAAVDFIQFEIDAAHVINCGVEAQIQNYKPPKGWGGYLIGVPVIHEALGDYSIGMYAFDAFGANYDVPEYKEAVKRVSSKTESYSSVTASYFISALLMRDSIARLGDRITRTGLRDVLNTFTDWTPGLTTDPNQPSWTWRPHCHVALEGGYVIQIQKVDGKLRWQQITPQFTTTPLPPGAKPPAEFSGCDIFRKG